MRSTCMRSLAGGTALAWMLAAAPAAYAEDIEASAVSSAQESPDAAASDDDAGGEEIIVTAQKREERLKEVPISISAVTGDQLQRQGASRFSDYAGYIPGLTYRPGSQPGQGEFNLRGVTTGSSPTASTAIYIDEVSTTTHGTWGGSNFKPVDLFPYDMERVEVLRGPQGTLYGDSTIGGLIKYVTRGADVDDFSGAAGVEGIAVDGGDGLGGGARAMLNVPIVPGVVGIRVSGFYQKNPGFVSNPLTGEDGVNESEQKGWRVALRAVPSDDFTIDAQWVHSEFDADGMANTRLLPDSTTPVYGDYEYDGRVPEPMDQKFDLLSLTARYDFGPVNLTSVTGYSKAYKKTIGDNSDTLQAWIDILTGGAVTDGLGVFESPTTNEKFSQEVRLASRDDQRFTWLIGGFYSVEDTDTIERLVPYDSGGNIITDLLEVYKDEVTARYEDISIFGNLGFKITDKWEITGGIRQSWITNDFHERASGWFLSGDPVIPYFDDINAKFKSTTWALSTRYIANDDLMMFARAASGFRAGGINYTWPGAQKSYDPDSLISYEAGIRADFMEDRANIDLTLYYLDWKDLFILAYTPDEFQFGYQTNGGRANGFGAEFTGTLRPARGLTLIGTAAYFGLKIREDLPTIGAEAGDRTPNSPAWSGSFLADYRTRAFGDWDLSVGGGLRWASHTYSRFIHDPRAVRIGSYTAIDLNAALSNDRWTVRAYVKNLTNNDDVLTVSAQGYGVQMTPRTIGLAVDLRF